MRFNLVTQRPNDAVTRGQMAAFLVRAFGYSAGSGADLFIDDDGSTFENDIDRLGKAGITNGCNPPTNDRYCPDDPVLRDQMGSFLSRALELTNTTPPQRTDTALGTQMNLIVIANGQGCDLGDSEDGILTECEASTSIASGDMFYIDHGWGEDDWSSLSAQEQAEFISDSTRFDLSLNDFELSTFETFTFDGNSAGDGFRFQFPGSLSKTTHELIGEWVWNDILELRITLHLTVNP